MKTLSKETALQKYTFTLKERYTGYMTTDVEILASSKNDAINDIYAKGHGELRDMVKEWVDEGADREGYIKIYHEEEQV
jgi:hypothetical protein